MAKQYKVKTYISYCYLVFSSVFFKNCFSKYKIMLKIHYSRLRTSCFVLFGDSIASVLVPYYAQIETQESFTQSALQVGEEILRWPVEAKIIYAVIAEPKHAVLEITSNMMACAESDNPHQHLTTLKWNGVLSLAQTWREAPGPCGDARGLGQRQHKSQGALLKQRGGDDAPQAGKTLDCHTNSSLALPLRGPCPLVSSLASGVC